MLARSLVRSAWIVATAMSLGSAAAAAQASPCTYARCALRLTNEFTPFPSQIVQGIEARPVATIGLFAPRITVLEASPDSVRRPYEAFRKDINRSGVLWLVGAAALVSAPFFFHEAADGHDGALIAALSIGGGVSIAGLVERARGASRLHVALRRYNEALPDGR